MAILFSSSTKMTTSGIKKSKEDTNKEVHNIDVSEEAKSYLEKILGDVSKSSAAKQILIGSTTGWYLYFTYNY